jgi:hypothetical protein
MSSQQHHSLEICVDRLPPGQRYSAFYQGDRKTRAAALRNKLWERGRTLSISFLDGDRAMHAKVEMFAQEWTQVANINFAFGSNPNAEIRIAFSQPGSWSLIGKDALDPRTPKHHPTMNFGWLTPGLPNDQVRRVVLHEFGHALGLVHEHQNPATHIPWNKEAVYRFYQGAPNFWSKEQVDINIFQVYDQTLTLHTEFDPRSIMLYPVPAELTTGGFSVGWNNDLSDTDKAFIAQQYPPTKPPVLRGGLTLQRK